VKIIVLLIWAVLLASCSNTHSSDSLRAKSDQSPLPDTCCGGEAGGEVLPGLKSFNLGKLPQGPIASHTFTVENHSSEVATFRARPEVSFPCCMKAELNPNEIPPNGVAELTITYKTRTRPGLFDLFVNLDPVSGKVSEQFHLGGEVEKSFVVAPRRLELKPEEPQFIEVSGLELGNSVSIERVTTNSEEIEVAEVEPEGRISRYRVTWSGQPVTEDVPVVYVISDNERFGWVPVLLYGVKKDS